MKTFSFLFCLFLISQSAFVEDMNVLTKAEVDSGWALLFDGKDVSQHLRGYKIEKLPKQWVVEDGVLTRKGGGVELLRNQMPKDPSWNF
jgi:hypothetical protein